ncbi:MAG: Crp/Fnr family transcriptional regulator [Gammaproteobacteria bacterium]
MLDKLTYWKTHFPEFPASNDPAVSRLMEAARLVRLPAGQAVFHAGGCCENYLLMLQGCVRTQLISESGREVLLYHVRSGDSCVLTTSCLLSGERYPAEGFTEDEVLAFVIPAAEFHQALDRSAFFRRFVFQNFARRLGNVISRMEEVVFGPIDSRLAKALLASGKKIVTKTHQELASELGTAREVVSRHLKRFELCGWVNLSRGAVEIAEIHALQQLADKAHVT